MTAPPVFPIARMLVPGATTALPSGMTEATFDLTAGVPATFALSKELSIAVVVPTGQVQSVLDADGAAVASSDRPQRSAFDGVAETIGSTARLPARLVLHSATAVLGSLPLVAGLRSAFPDDGGDVGVSVEIAVLEWSLRAGTLVGPGGFGSRLRLGWRAIGAAADSFQPPVEHPSDFGWYDDDAFRYRYEVSDEDSWEYR